MKPESFITEALVTPVRQRTQYTCVPCSLMMCLNALGMDLTEEEVNKVMGARPMQGATWEQVVATTQHFGKRATLTAPCNIEQLKEWTSRGLPVIIAYNPEGRDWSHASVVYSVSNDLTQVTIADPNMPNPMETTRIMSVEQFYKVWYEKWPNYLVRRPACVISPEISQRGMQVMPPQVRLASKKPSSYRVAQRYLTAGRTHYWNMSRDFSDKEWSKILREAKSILTFDEGGFWVAGGNGKGKPELKKDYILFNGSLGDVGEDFYLSKEMQDFAFCKTYGYEYDDAVIDVLKAAKKIAPDAIKIDLAR